MVREKIVNLQAPSSFSFGGKFCQFFIVCVTFPSFLRSFDILMLVFASRMLSRIHMTRTSVFIVSPLSISRQVTNNAWHECLCSMNYCTNLSLFVLLHYWRKSSLFSIVSLGLYRRKRNDNTHIRSICNNFYLTRSFCWRALIADVWSNFYLNFCVMTAFSWSS